MNKVVKRKRKVVTIAQKLEAIKRLDQGNLLKNVASDYGVGVSTVAEWRQKRNKLEQWSSVLASPNVKRKSMKSGEYNKIDEALYLWFTQQRDKGTPLSGPILQEKAISISEDLPVREAPDTFTASDGWLGRWKKRHGIRNLKICGEKLSADMSAVDDFKEDFKRIVEENGYVEDQIYNCDETGLNYKMLPNSTLASKNEAAAPGYKKSKERVTILACANYSGRHKLPLMMIGKSVKPRAFKHVAPNALPVYYKNQKSAWMDAALFKNWFFEQFVPKTEKFLKKNRLPRKALLLLDNAPSHPDVNELKSGDIKVMYLPPNVTAILQPMDQGVLENLKRNYRRSLLQELLQPINENNSLVSCLKKINLKDVAYWTTNAWNSVKSITIHKSWSKIMGQDENENETPVEDQPAEESLHELIKKIEGCDSVTEEEVERWVTSDELEEELTNNELIEILDSQQEKRNEMNENFEEMEDEVPKISDTEGMKALEISLAYVEQQPNATASDVLLIKRWRDIAARNRGSMLKQTRIDSFFK